MFEDRDYNFRESIELPTVEEMKQKLRLSPEIRRGILAHRQTVSDIISGRDSRLLLIAGPCSIHNPDSALLYARKLNELRKRYAERLFFVMRCYVEKSRTGTGWPGFALDPELDGSFHCREGIFRSRGLMLQIAELGMPVGMEFVFPAVSEYFLDLLSWGCIGARCVTSPLHRYFASALNIPVGIKNALSGDVATAVRAMNVIVSKCPFAEKNGVFSTAGNPNPHIVLRGGPELENFSAERIAELQRGALQSGAPFVIDCSHDNAAFAGGQMNVFRKSLENMVNCRQCKGFMFESFLRAGRQQNNGRIDTELSLTDECIDLDALKRIAGDMAAAREAF